MSKHWWAKMILETRCSIGGRIAHAFFTIPAIRIPSDVTRRKSATEDIGPIFLRTVSIGPSMGESISMAMTVRLSTGVRSWRNGLRRRRICTRRPMEGSGGLERDPGSERSAEIHHDPRAAVRFLDWRRAGMVHARYVDVGRGLGASAWSSALNEGPRLSHRG